MTMVTRAEEHLLIEIKDGKLEITIGIDTLACAVRVGLINSYHLEGEPVVVDIMSVAHDIVDALSNEDEDGTTIVHQMFDKAACHAVEYGTAGIIMPEEDRGF